MDLDLSSGFGFRLRIRIESDRIGFKFEWSRFGLGLEFSFCFRFGFRFKLGSEISAMKRTRASRATYRNEKRWAKYTATLHTFARDSRFQATPRAETRKV